jgi:hypothetical protein
VVGGSFSYPGTFTPRTDVVRLNVDGTLDTAFAPNYTDLALSSIKGTLKNT